MKRIMRANKQLLVSEESVPVYLSLGYVEVDEDGRPLEQESVKPKAKRTVEVG